MCRRTRNARTDILWKNYPHTTLHASISNSLAEPSPKTHFCASTNHICLCSPLSDDVKARIEIHKYCTVSGHVYLCFMMAIYSWCVIKISINFPPLGLSTIPAHSLWLINNSINFSERRRQRRSRHERWTRMAEGLHRKRSRRVHSRRRHSTEPSGFR